MAKTLVSGWAGATLFDGESVVRELRAPTDADALADRLRRRLAGEKTPEEEALLALRGEETWRTADRRLVRSGILYAPGVRSLPFSGDAALHRAAILRHAESALEDAWDPSVHVEEAVRALRDLDRAANLLGERVVSWAARDFPELEGADPLAAARALRDTPPGSSGQEEAETARARRRLAELLLTLAETRTVVDGALKAVVPVQTPNLNHLLGPELAARLIAQAGGLARLAHLPASTVQVLGAERAFFEHLRGRAPPPRHGLLFLHSAVQSAPRAHRGKLARALAAKAAIAARLDHAGSAINPSLATAFEARRAAIRAAGPGRRAKPERGRLRPPLDRAAGDRQR